MQENAQQKQDLSNRDAVAVEEEEEEGKEEFGRENP